MCEGVVDNAVEGQLASLPVQVHPDLVAVLGGISDGRAAVVVPRIESPFVETQRPGTRTETKATVNFPPTSVDTGVGHANLHVCACPLYHPVMALTQGLTAEELAPTLEALSTGRIELLVHGAFNQGVAVGQFEVHIHCVFIKGEPAGIYMTGHRLPKSMSRYHLHRSKAMPTLSQRYSL